MKKKRQSKVVRVEHRAGGVVRVQISLSQRFSKSVSFRMTKSFNKSTLMEVSQVFGTLQHVNSRSVL